ncbi:MAG: hypothetical protein KJ709_00720 [Nanoarchaeota archaeon]|nr:hypothetical protein [Nanoarchaeota archaeon]
MKRIILMLILTVFIMGCSEQMEKTQEIEDIVEEPELKPETEESISPPDEELQKEPVIINEKELFCPDYDGNEQECFLHEECEWDAQENNCDLIGRVNEEDDNNKDDKEAGFASELENGLPNTIPNKICKKLPLTNQLNPGDRHYCFALVNHNAEFCKNIDDEEKEVNRCLAHATGDSSYCERLQDDSAKHVCYYMLAVSSENADFCSEIDYSLHEKEQCYFTFVSNLYWFDQSDEITTEYCSQLGDPDEDTCLALKERDVSLCKNNVNCLTFFEQEMSFCDSKGSILKDCVRDRAMTSKDVSICEELSGEKKDDCIGDFCTHIQLDLAICDKITNIQERQSRYVEVAMNLGNDARGGN